MLKQKKKRKRHIRKGALIIASFLVANTLKHHSPYQVAQANVESDPCDINADAGKCGQFEIVRLNPGSMQCLILYRIDFFSVCRARPVDICWTHKTSFYENHDFAKRIHAS